MTHGSTAATAETGYAELDQVLDGGLTRGAVTVVGARPTMGKTSFAFNVAAGTARRGLRTIVGSMGESPGDARSLLRSMGDQHECTEFDVIDDADPSPHWLAEAVRMRSTEVPTGGSVDVAIFDGLRTTVDQPFDAWSDATRLTSDMSGLRSLAEGHGCAILVLTRLAPLDTGSDQLRPTLADVPVAVSSAADTVLLLHQPLRPDVASPIAPVSDVELVVAQHRFTAVDRSMSLTYIAGDRRFRPGLAPI